MATKRKRDSPSQQTSATMTELTPTPVVLQARGMAADTRLQVFDNEYHVHSALLKMHSAFFFKFMDPSSESFLVETSLSGTREASYDFEYEWSTQVDENGTWSLVAAHHAATIDEYKLKGSKVKEMKAFSNVLSAIYGVAYNFIDHQDLMLTTSKADYYCALPALSRSFLNAYLLKPFSISKCPVKIIRVARKLRHSQLYRDCVAYLAGCWDDADAYELGKLNDADYGVVTTAKTEVLELLVKSHVVVTKVMAKEEEFKDLVNGIKLDEYFVLPSYYQSIADLNYDDISNELDILDELLDNKLGICCFSDRPGRGRYKKYFLCAQGSDDDLPWDHTEVDW